MPETETRCIRSPDGRTLHVRIARGNPGCSVLVMHGMPGSSLLYGNWIEDAAARGIRLVSYDRPGYGGSSPHSGHSVADCASDVEAIADHLGMDRFGVWGWSGGGPYALACAAMLPDRVVAAALIASVAPWGADGLDFFAGMGQDNIDSLRLYFSDPSSARAKSMQDRDATLATTPGQQEEMLGTLLSKTDAAVLTGKFAEWLLRAEQNGLEPGDDGWWDDGAAHLSPWGFQPESVNVPVKVWHGRQDQFVPIQHGQWLVDHIAGAASALSDTDGHLTLVTEKIGEVHEWLISQPPRGNIAERSDETT
ncbi:MAG: alpha/beta fold hydrolase [Solirubrobacteraceae bacterium]